MTDIWSKRKRSEVMALVRSQGNKATELRLISIMREAGIAGWRRRQKLPGKPDFVFPKQRLAVFVDGCFWHGCPWHGTQPTTNGPYWRKKIAVNMARDKRVTQELKGKRWRVLRIWEHSLKDTAKVIERISRFLT